MGPAPGFEISNKKKILIFFKSAFKKEIQKKEKYRKRSKLSTFSPDRLLVAYQYTETSAFAIRHGISRARAYLNTVLYCIHTH